MRRSGDKAEMDPQTISKYFIGLEDRVHIACHNSPTNVTLAGVLSALEEVQARLRQDNHACRMLQVDIPYHSKFVAATAEAFEQSTLQERPLVQELGCSGGVTNAVDRHWQPIGGPDLQQLILESQLGVSSFIPSRNGSYPPSWSTPRYPY